MTETWKITAAKRFNDKIRMTPYDPDVTPSPKLVHREEPTLAELVGNVYDSQLKIYQNLVDTAAWWR